MMGAAVVPHRLCAVNPDHGAATTPTFIDGRRFMVCAGCCCDDVEKRRRPRDRKISRSMTVRGPLVAALMAVPGGGFEDLGRACGFERGSILFASMKRVMCDLVSAGEVVREGPYHAPRFWLAGDRRPS